MADSDEIRREYLDLARKRDQGTLNQTEKSRYFEARREYFAELLVRLGANRIERDEFELLGAIIIQEVRAVAQAKFALDGSEFAGAVFEKVLLQHQKILMSECPWAFFLRVITNTILDHWRSVGRRRTHEVSVDSSSEEDVSGGSFPESVDASPDPAEAMTSTDDIRVAEELLTGYRNQRHIDYFRHSLMGYSKVEIARRFQVTENAVQLAIGRILDYLRKNWTG